MLNKQKVKSFLKLSFFYLISVFITALEIFIIINIISSFFIKKQRNFYEICSSLYKDFFKLINFDKLAELNIAKKLDNLNIKFFSKKINQMIKFSIALFFNNLLFFSIIIFCTLYKAKLVYKYFFIEGKLKNKDEKEISFLNGFVLFLYSIIIISIFFEILDISLQKFNIQNFYICFLICLISSLFVVYTCKLIYSCICDIILSFNIKNKDDSDIGPLSQLVYLFCENHIQEIIN